MINESEIRCNASVLSQGLFMCSFMLLCPSQPPSCGLRHVIALGGHVRTGQVLALDLAVEPGSAMIRCLELADMGGYVVDWPVAVMDLLHICVEGEMHQMSVLTLIEGRAIAFGAVYRLFR